MNPKSVMYANYGGKGIVVCERWQTSFESFLADMGLRPSSRHTLDRYPDQCGNYEPGNCRWATRREQDRNKRTNRMLTFAGKTQCIADWAREVGMSQSRIRVRLLKGWGVEDALTNKSRVRGGPPQSLDEDIARRAERYFDRHGTWPTVRLMATMLKLKTDKLEAIAKKHYGDGIRLMEIGGRKSAGNTLLIIA